MHRVPAYTIRLTTSRPWSGGTSHRTGLFVFLAASVLTTTAIDFYCTGGFRGNFPGLEKSSGASSEAGHESKSRFTSPRATHRRCDHRDRRFGDESLRDSSGSGAERRHG